MPPTRPSIETSVETSTAPVLAQASKASLRRLPMVGEQFDKYTLLAKLATGGMAELFVARLSGAAGFRKNVVIKRILPHVAHDEHFTRMFLDEAITCAQISHPNVCQVFELCEAQGSHFLVLEHLEGATVGDLIRRCLMAAQQVNLSLAAGIIVQACDGLHAAHEQVDEDETNVGLVHRDVSPGNLFVTVDGIVKVLDFGIAKAAWMSRKTRTGTLLGKCEYMSPEQARGDGPIDRRSDIFSLGIIAWEMLCGRRLFRRESEYETLRAVLRDPIESPRQLRPTIPESLDRAIMRALERDPDDRYRTANEFRHAINLALKEKGGPTPMCDIAPLIRSAFAEELRIQRAVLKEATRFHQTSRLRRVARGTKAPKHDPRDATDVRTQPHQALPSVEFRPEGAESSELTFRVIPKTPPVIGALVPAQPSGAQQSSSAPTERLTPPLRPTAASGEIPRSAQKASHDVIAASHRVITPTSESGDIAARMQTVVPQKQTHALLLSCLVVLLGAFVVVTLTYLYYSDKGAQGTHASVSQAATTLLPHPAMATGSPVSDAAPATQVPAASTEPVIVTTLPSTAPKLGTITIRSSQPATIYLYPEKKIIGITPLINYPLPAGRHKLKAQVGAAKGQRKYFYIKTEQGEKSERSFEHWPR